MSNPRPLNNYFGFGEPVENFIHFVEPGESILVSQAQAQLIKMESKHQAIDVAVSDCAMFPTICPEDILPVQKICKVTKLPAEGAATGLVFVNRARKQFSLVGENAAMIFTNGLVVRKSFRAGINANLLTEPDKVKKYKPETIGVYIVDKALDLIYRAYVIRMVPNGFRDAES